MGLKIANSTVDCNPGPDQNLERCEEDIAIIVEDIDCITDSVSDAVVDCGDGIETACTDDIDKILNEIGRLQGKYHADANLAIHEAEHRHSMYQAL